MIPCQTEAASHTGEKMVMKESKHSFNIVGLFFNTVHTNDLYGPKRRRDCSSFVTIVFSSDSETKHFIFLIAKHDS